ncbi:MAG: class I SAM-dependent methyltransferase [Lentisphaeria bacterium]
MATAGWQKLESRFYGKKWDAIHGGYFSNPVMAAPFVETIAAAVRRHRPDAVVDLGGGSGFVLGELAKRDLGGTPRLINVDASPDQLTAAKARGLECLNVPAEKFTRDMALKDGGRLMLVMRSVLHYYQAADHLPFLLHLRRQLQEKELFLHQTLAFASPRETAAINALYALMRTTKAFFTPAEIAAMLATGGFVTPKPRHLHDVPVPSNELASRYQLGPRDIRAIIDRVGTLPGTSKVFTVTGTDSFRMFLKYYLFKCTAVPAAPAG